MSKAISPALASGFRDYLPSNMIARQKMLETIRTVFERFGFLPLETPGIERLEVLTGGDPEFKKQIFGVNLLNSDRLDEQLALRFDLTVPLARVVALHSHDISKPFKRYQVGNVWRGEKPQAGRFCEFVQFDADIVGSDRSSADAEIISLMYTTLSELGIEHFVIKVNNRKILNGLPSYVGFPKDNVSEVLRNIDKIDRLGWDNVAGELSDNVGLGAEQLQKLKTFLDVQDDDHLVVIKNIKEIMSDSQEALSGIEELTTIVNFVDTLGIPRDKWKIDLSIARGLGYYTGPVFETTLLDLPSVGSVFSGGRYDDLVSRFGNDVVPATGASVGVDRLFYALTELNLVPKVPTLTQAIVLNFDSPAQTYCHEVLRKVREANIRSEIYLGKEKTLKGQLAYAIRTDIPFVLIAGEREREQQTVQVKDIREKKQSTHKLSDFVVELKKLIR